MPAPPGAQTAPALPVLQAPGRLSGHSPSRSCPKLCDVPTPWPPEPLQPQIWQCLSHAQNTLWECRERASGIPVKEKREVATLLYPSGLHTCPPSQGDLNSTPFLPVKRRAAMGETVRHSDQSFVRRIEVFIEDCWEFRKGTHWTG